MDESSCIHRKERLLALLSTMEAEDALMPLSLTTMFDIHTSYDEIMKTIIKDQNIFYPIYQERIDNIVGVLHVRDLLCVSAKDFHLSKFLHQPFFISENTKLDDLFIQLDQKMDFAIVVDEHGSVRGSITHKDIREALCIDDQSNQTKTNIIKDLDSSFLINAQMSLDEFNQTFNLDLVSEECDTIGGFVIEEFTYVPQNNEILVLDSLEITIKKSEGAKLKELSVRLIQN